MVKHTQTICRQKPTNCLSVFDHFVGLTLKRLIERKFGVTFFPASKKPLQNISTDHKVEGAYFASTLFSCVGTKEESNHGLKVAEHGCFEKYVIPETENNHEKTLIAKNTFQTS